MIQRTLTLFASGAVIALFACSSDDGDKFPSVDSFCSAKAEALCANVAAGCGTTPEKCKPSASSVCVAQSNGLGRAYKASAAEDCINKTRDTYAKKNVTADDEKALADTCAKVFPGTKLKAEKCAVDEECVDGLVCDQVDKSCATKNERKLDDQCNNAGDVCEKGTYCQARGARSYCSPKNKLNEICAIPDKPCAEDLRCNNNTSCVLKSNIGETCAVDSDCVGTSTAPYCDTLSRQCKQRYGGGTQSCKDVGG